jgi:hypothetical protein
MVTPFRRKQLVGVAGALPAFVVVALTLDHLSKLFEFIALPAWTGLAISLPIAHIVLIPAMATLFAICRGAFWVGYLIYPMGRAFGMVLTALPTIASYAWLVWHT